MARFRIHKQLLFMYFMDLFQCIDIDVLRAEKRYLLWLKILNNVSFKDDEEIPILPIDVCQVWYAHLLSPLRYFEDTKRLYKREFTFPLAQLHELWSKTNGDHMDERSKQFWEENTKQPWILDPNDTSDFELVCPWCSTTLMITADILVSTVNGEYNEEKAISDSDYLFKLTKFLFQNVRIGIIRNVIFAYSGTPLPFSIGLVNSPIKWSITLGLNDSAVQSQATIRYNKFLLLQKDAKSCLVSTLDIDLCWHTHMLHAPLYRNSTNKQINRIINHCLNQLSLMDLLKLPKMVTAVILPPYAIYLMYKMNKYKKGTVKKDKIQNSSTEKTEYEEKE
ncbi:hypothetical protein C2G38_2213315 [Gigaspora rosea]|uniref:Uncharacterized protein n=1 Tax=Gigaspora rosea TaxID=44941 RepID=A0A397UC15_9GLOM|nr:hypothetical protein C2G38_2213315 [Gigaspora rosea]